MQSLVFKVLELVQLQQVKVALRQALALAVFYQRHSLYVILCD